MNEEELVSYVVRYCKHELSEEEYRFLQRWLEEKQENRQTFREWVRTYRQGRKVGCWDGIQEEQAWEQISCRLSASPRKRRRLWKEWWRRSVQSRAVPEQLRYAWSLPECRTSTALRPNQP